MSPRAASDGGGGGGRVAMSALLIVVLAVGMMLIVRARPQSEPFDPRSGEPMGTRALVLLLRERGATVTVSRDAVPTDASARVLVLQDRLSDEQRSDLVDFVERGGVAIVADPLSTLHGGPGVDGGSIDNDVGDTIFVATDRSVTPEINLPIGDCTVPALQHLRGLYVTDGLLFPAGSTEQTCFDDGAHTFVVVSSVGDGVVVGLGDNVLFTNGRLRFADNSGLATALLAPDGAGEVHIVLGSEAAKNAADLGAGDQTLSDLVRPGVWMALVQLAAAFVVFAMARAIRPGRPVNEPLPAPVEGSEFVVATGNLMQRAQHGQRAGWLIRGQLYRRLCTTVNLPPTVPIAELDRVVSDRFGLEAGAVAEVLNTDVSDGESLLRLSRRIDDLTDRITEGAPR